MKQCLKCKKVYPIFKFCYECGIQLEPFEPPKCSRCDENVMPHHKFCTNCGLPRADALKEKD